MQQLLLILAILLPTNLCFQHALHVCQQLISGAILLFNYSHFNAQLLYLLLCYNRKGTYTEAVIDRMPATHKHVKVLHSCNYYFLGLSQVLGCFH